jgi:hypothetical protein
MADSLFNKYQAQAFKAGVAPRSVESRKWFMNKLKDLRNVSRTQLLNDPAVRAKNRLRVGSMYMYFYDPKHKKTLPYYDRFPLTIMVEPAPGGFYGINLHYLPPILRAKMFDALLDITNNTRYDESTKFKLSYDLLKSSSKLRWFAPCFKRYLYSHVKNSPVIVDATEWEVAMFLPTEQFKKDTRDNIWKESRKSVGR